MAETNSPRFGLRIWGTGTDTPSRLEFNDAFSKIEDRGGIDKQGATGDRPAAGVRGTYWFDTTTSALWRDSGSAWFNVGSRTYDTQIRSSVIGNVPLTVDTPNGQTANLFEVKTNGTTKYSISKDGNVTAANYTGVQAALTQTVTTNPVFVVKGAVAQSANLIEAKNSGDTNQFVVSSAGAVTSTYFKSGTSSVLNSNTASNVANMASWSGTPSFEVRMNGTGAFKDFMYLSHGVADASAATRQLGILMKAGAEDVPGAGRSAALYVQSLGANFDNPVFNIDVRDQKVWGMSPGGSFTGYDVNVEQAKVRVTTNNTAGYEVDSAKIGTQGGGFNMYLRSGSTGTGHYFYAGGVHDPDAADPGVGGITLGSLLPESSIGRFTAGRMTLTSPVSVNTGNVGSVNPGFRLGSSSGQNVVLDSASIFAINNGAFAEMHVQDQGGKLWLGGPGTSEGTAVATSVYINDRLLWMSFTGPTNAQDGDLWLDLNVGAGFKRRLSGSWVKFLG